MTSPAPPRAGAGNVVLAAGPPGWWDSQRVSSPRVLRLPDGSWRMWYYGRDPAFDPAIDLPAGRSGLAVSSNGIDWWRVPGPGTMGSVLEPSRQPGWFDSAHLGITDVVWHDGLFRAVYLGGDDEVAFRGDELRKGLRMGIGLALSRDGLHWTKVRGGPNGAVLDHGEGDDWDALFAGWPGLFRRDDGLWILHYHTLDPRTRTFTAGLATSWDGLRFTRHGPVLGPGPPGSWDERGVSCRHVLRIGQQWVMFYEGVSASGRVSIGLAVSPDGLAWERSADGPVLEHGGLGDWDGHAVGIPCVVPMPGGTWRLYYVGANETGRDSELTRHHAIGLAVSDGPDWHRWHRDWRRAAQT